MLEKSKQTTIFLNNIIETHVSNLPVELALASGNKVSEEESMKA